MKFAILILLCGVLGACSDTENADDTMSTLRTARSFALQAQLAIDESLANRTTPHFDSIYLAYLAHNLEAELLTESHMSSLDEGRHTEALRVFAATDSTVRDAVAHLGDSAYLRTVSARLRALSQSVAPLDTTRAE